MALIDLKNICKSYGDSSNKVDILKSVNLKIEEGELVAIIGPSGSGKSTLLNILGCIDVQTSGTYYFNGAEISKNSEKELAKIRNRDIGFVFQNFNLLNNYRLIDNVTLPLEYTEKKSKDKFARGSEALKSVGLIKHINKTPQDLSGGEKQRVAIARALINNPKLILADEPTGSLDQNTGNAVLSIFKELNAKGVTVIIITHDMKVASSCNRIIEIQDGMII